MKKTSQQSFDPPDNLREMWVREATCGTFSPDYNLLIDRSSQWAADAELEACREWANSRFLHKWGDELYTARRPESLSLKRRALNAHSRALSGSSLPGDADIIAQALETIPE